MGHVVYAPDLVRNMVRLNSGLSPARVSYYCWSGSVRTEDCPRDRDCRVSTALSVSDGLAPWLLNCFDDRVGFYQKLPKHVASS